MPHALVGRRVALDKFRRWSHESEAPIRTQELGLTLALPFLRFLTAPPRQQGTKMGTALLAPTPNRRRRRRRKSF